MLDIPVTLESCCLLFVESTVVISTSPLILHNREIKVITNFRIKIFNNDKTSAIKNKCYLQNLQITLVNFICSKLLNFELKLLQS